MSLGRLEGDPPPRGTLFQSNSCLLSADRLVFVPWITHTFLFIELLNFDANLSTKENRNHWEKLMETIILSELAVRGSGGGHLPRSARGERERVS